MQAQNTSRSTNDTICKPVAEYKLIFKDARLYRYTDSLLKLTERQISELKYTMGLLIEKDSATVAGYKNQISIMYQEQAIYKDQVNTFEKLLRREKRKRFWTSAGGVVATGLAIYLSTIK